MNKFVEYAEGELIKFGIVNEQYYVKQFLSRFPNYKLFLSNEEAVEALIMFVPKEFGGMGLGENIFSHETSRIENRAEKTKTQV